MDFDKKLFEEACRDYVLEVINESKYLRQNLPLVEHAKIYDWVKTKANYNQLVSIILPQEPATKETVLKFESTTKEFIGVMLTEAEEKAGEGGEKKGPSKFVKGLKHPIWTGIKFVAKHPIYSAAIIAAGTYLYRRFFDPCMRQCKGDPLCVRTCRVDSIKKVITQLEAQKSQCSQSTNVEKCKKGFDKAIEKWNKKLRKVLSAKYKPARVGSPV